VWKGVVCVPPGVRECERGLCVPLGLRECKEVVCVPPGVRECEKGLCVFHPEGGSVKGGGVTEIRGLRLDDQD
jgi:hypothetical protein